MAEQDGKRVRHVLGLSGGKDSTALAILMHKEVPEMEYFFCDTHEELPETYEYLERIENRLGIKIARLSDKRGFQHWLDVYDGALPSPKMRWCTKQMKIKPLEEFIGNDKAISYIGIRADEHRDGYISTKPNITARYPFRELGLGKSDIIRIVEDSGIGMPSYYNWRSRSGCYFCFFQRKYEWVMLSREHPDLFQKAVEYEQDHKDQRVYTWSESETLLELLERSEEVIQEHERSVKRHLANKPNKPLSEVLDELAEEDDLQPCTLCHL